MEKIKGKMCPERNCKRRAQCEAGGGHAKPHIENSQCKEGCTLQEEKGGTKRPCKDVYFVN